MNAGLHIFKKLKELLFGKKKEMKVSGSIPEPSLSMAEAQPRASPGTKGLSAVKRDPYFIQIGFDFGTSYSKCVCRDVMTNKAWVYIPTESEDQETPFLIPSTLLLQDGKFGYFQSPSITYYKDGLHHLKLALVKIALKEWDDPVLAPYREIAGGSRDERLVRFVRACGVFFLARALGDVRKDIRRQFPDFGSQPDDYMAVNLAVPVADAERPAVNDLYHEILCNAWFLADQVAGYPEISSTEIEELITRNQAQHRQELKEACYLYPEVSANVQGFVRSRVSSEGIYLFSDTGAGSVDQSVFIFFRRDGREECLTYLHGSVFPMGSSRIEYLAASASGQVNWQALEIWRKKKESGGTEPELQRARDRIGKELSEGTETTLAWARKKLYVQEQLNNIRLIFGGGGHCEHPYKTAVMRPFSGNLFPRGISPDIVGLPVPRDLELGDRGAHWMRRLSVAYGLSFTRHELADFTYPKDVDNPKPAEIWKPSKKVPEAPTKDVC